MSRSIARTLAPAVALAAALAVAAPALATEWIIDLDNGTRFTSRYQPVAASWDSGLVLLVTEEGNHIGLERSMIKSVTADVQNRGFGTVIDDKTISLGQAPNDLPAPEDTAKTSLSPEMQLLQSFIQSQQAPQQNYNVDQFVDPSQAGGGLPAAGYGYGGGATGAVVAPLPITGGTSLGAPASSVPAQGTSVPAQGSSVPPQ